MKQKKAITIAMLVLLVFFIYYAINAAPLVSDEKYTYIGGMEWYNTYDEGKSIALEQNKPMLVYFWTIWCTWCEKMQTEVFPREEISRILKENFILIAVDMDVNREDTQRFDAQYPPQELFLTPTGEVIIRIPGYISAEDFLPILRQVTRGYGGGR